MKRYDVYSTPGPISNRLRIQYGSDVGDWPATRKGADDSIPAESMPHDGFAMGSAWLANNWVPFSGARKV